MHDHVLNDLAERYDAVLEAIEATDGWVTNRLTPGKVILGELGGTETGVRQLIRKVPLEVAEVELPSGHTLRVPTPDEALRVKGNLIVRRNQARDYLDVAALSDRYGIAHAGKVLANMDRYYADQRGPEAVGVATQLIRQLASPQQKIAARPSNCPDTKISTRVGPNGKQLPVYVERSLSRWRWDSLPSPHLVTNEHRSQVP